jgi:hypothetical protein
MIKIKKKYGMMKTDAYAKKFIKAICNCTTNEELINIINKIYENGFEDGANETTKTDTCPGDCNCRDCTV